ncbi:MAG: hypothetical protein ACRDRL_06135 [Sciscionella sp.]
MGAGASCPASAQDSQPAGNGVRSGDTGDVLGVALAGDGTAVSSAVSGDSGAVLAGRDGGRLSAPITGNTGPAVGIAIARHAATALVHSGSSGTADAICTNCGGAAAPAGGTAIAIAASGDTGISYSLAIAGVTASVRSESGDSGSSIAWTIEGSARTRLTAGNTGSGQTVGGRGPGSVIVAGRSGKTGDTVVVAVGLDSWIDLWTYTGRSGPVVSTATWGVSGCTFVIATLTAKCAGIVPPPTGTPAARHTGATQPGERRQAGTPDASGASPTSAAGTSYDLPGAGFARLRFGSARGPAGGTSVLVPLTPSSAAQPMRAAAAPTDIPTFAPAAVSNGLPRAHSNGRGLLILITGLAVLAIALCLVARRRGRQNMIRHD